MSLVMRKPAFAYAKTKTQISFAVTAKLISTFVFASRIVQSLYFLNPKFHASRHLQWLYSPVCIGPGQKPRRPVFSQRGSNNSMHNYRYNTLLFNELHCNTKSIRSAKTLSDHSDKKNFAACSPSCLSQNAI